MGCGGWKLDPSIPWTGRNSDSGHLRWSFEPDRVEALNLALLERSIGKCWTGLGNHN
jgi:hypothetical protein